MKCTEAIIQRALCPMMHLTQQRLCDPELIILFDLAVTSNLTLPHSAIVYWPAGGTLHLTALASFLLAFAKEIK